MSARIIDHGDGRTFLVFDPDPERDEDPEVCEPPDDGHGITEDYYGTSLYGGGSSPGY